MNQIIAVHIFAIFAHYSYELLDHSGFKYVGYILLVSKIFGYSAVIFHIHSGISFRKYAEITERSMVYAWLHYEVIAFYANLGACMVFLAIALEKKFRNFRDRAGLAS
jgi:hypothetical protein